MILYEGNLRHSSGYEPINGLADTDILSIVSGNKYLTLYYRRFYFLLPTGHLEWELEIVKVPIEVSVFLTGDSVEFSGILTTIQSLSDYYSSKYFRMDD